MGENGSVNDYFRAQSYGRLNVTFENIGSYTASGKASDYAENDASSKMLRQAVQSLTEVDRRNPEHQAGCRCPAGCSVL